MKNVLSNLCEELVCQFGFENLNEFMTSMVHHKLLLFTLPSSIFLFGVIEKYFGITSAIFGAFVVLAILELVTGVWGAVAQKKKLQSKKVGRFGLKLLVWMSLIFVSHSFAQSYEDLKGFQNVLVFQIFSWFHGVLMVYVSFEYIISILENLGKITGNTNNRLINFLNNRLDKVLGEEKDLEVAEKEDNEEEVKDVAEK